jgi:ABC-2 type transport system permease protein
MKMNIYQHEFKMSLKSVVIWSVSITILLVAFMSLFSSFAADAELLNEMMDKFPKELLMAFGMTDMDMASALGYFALIFLFCQICLAIQAANYGFSLVSIEERELTADFLLAKPVGRSTILTSKLLAAISGLTITNIVVWIISFISINIFRGGKEYDTRPLVLLLLSIVLFQLFFLSVGLVISLLVKRVRNVTPYSMGLAFGMYILNAFGNMIGEDSLEIISPFKHFEPNYIVKNAAYNLPLVLISVSVIIVSVAASYVLYSKRNFLTPV